MPFARSKKFRNSISVRIAFLFCFTFAVGLMFAFLVTYFELRYSLEKSSREILSAKLEEARTLIKTEGISGLRQFLSLEKNRILNAAYLFRVITDQGETLYLKPSVQEKNFDFDEAFSQKIKPIDKLGWHSIPAINDEDKFHLLTEKTDDPKIFIQVGESSEDREEILEQILLNFAIIEMILVFMSGFLGIWYARKSLAPLRGLLNTIRLIEKGNLSQRVPTSSTQDELQEISETFNRMITRIENLILVMRESLDNLAHEIRTPLTRIRSVAENALLSNETSSLKESLEDTAESSNQIAELVDQLLSVSEAQAGALKLNYERSPIRILILDVLDIYEFTAQEKQIRFDFSGVSPDIDWYLDRKRIKQVIANLVDNAIKFSQAGSQVSIQAQIQNDNLQIDVIDQGPGIAEADRLRVWDRLFRGDKNRSTKGSGLGLAIVQAVVMAHGGRCELHPVLPQGSRFSIFIPNKKP